MNCKERMIAQGYVEAENGDMVETLESGCKIIMSKGVVENEMEMEAFKGDTIDVNVYAGPIMFGSTETVQVPASARFNPQELYAEVRKKYAGEIWKLYWRLPSGNELRL